MTLQITQETFDNTVRENVDEFEMSLEEAIKETIEQFKTQVNYFFTLSNTKCQSSNLQMILGC